MMMRLTYTCTTLLALALGAPSTYVLAAGGQASDTVAQGDRAQIIARVRKLGLDLVHDYDTSFQLSADVVAELQFDEGYLSGIVLRKTRHAPKNAVAPEDVHATDPRDCISMNDIELLLTQVDLIKPLGESSKVFATFFPSQTVIRSFANGYATWNPLCGYSPTNNVAATSEIRIAYWTPHFGRITQKTSIRRTDATSDGVTEFTQFLLFIDGQQFSVSEVDFDAAVIGALQLFELLDDRARVAQSPN